MFSLTIVFGPGPMVWTLMFKTEQSAHDAQQQLISTVNDDHAMRTALLDDFGQDCCIITNEIKGWMLEDLEQSRLAHIERELHVIRTKLKANEIADADPQIRQARRNQQNSMPMLQPMPGGMMPGNGRFPS